MDNRGAGDFEFAGSHNKGIRIYHGGAEDTEKNGNRTRMSADFTDERGFQLGSWKNNYLILIRDYPLNPCSSAYHFFALTPCLRG